MDKTSLLPILDIDGERDERSDNVILTASEYGWKTTAEELGTFWIIRDWEILQLEGKDFWFCRSSFSIYKNMVELLFNAGN